MNQKIESGNYVRSFNDQDFQDVDGPNASFMEGIVIGFTEREGCTRYRIQANYSVRRGKGEPCDRIIVPPVNGTPRLLGGGVCNGVERI